MVRNATPPPSLHELLAYTAQLLAQVDELKAELARLRGTYAESALPSSTAAHVVELAAYRQGRRRAIRSR